MSIRKLVIGAVLVIIGLPAVLVLVVVVSVSFLNRTNGTIISSGQKREYLLYVPRSYDRAKPTPLVISMHGALLWPAAEMEASQWNKVADEHGFIVVYPSATGSPRTWGGDLDVRFISELIDKLEAEYNIDPARIYADGFSNGGGMALEVACGLPDRVAAIGAVAAALLRAPKGCQDSRPVPMVAFHGTADPLAPYQGGTSLASPPSTGIPFLAVRDWVTSRARLNRCEPSPIESVVATDVTRQQYTNCADDAAVVLYTIKGEGHQWPGGKPLPQRFLGPASHNIDATRTMWAFFMQHPLQRK